MPESNPVTWPPRTNRRLWTSGVPWIISLSKQELIQAKVVLGGAQPAGVIIRPDLVNRSNWCSHSEGTGRVVSKCLPLFPCHLTKAAWIAHREVC